MLDASDIAQTIRIQAAQKTAPFVIAIDGCSGAGKSTLASALEQHLGAARIEGDDFFAGPVTVSDVSPQEFADTCIDWRTQAKVLQSLIANETATFHPFDWHAFDGSKSKTAKTIEPNPIVILEGTYSARPELAHLIDYRILVTLDDKERMKRLIKREGPLSDWELQWHPPEVWYLSNVATPDSFDIVIG